MRKIKKFLLPVVTIATVGSVLFVTPTYAMGRHKAVTLTPAQRQSHLETRLSALVTQGKITAVQKQLIEDKLKQVFDQKQLTKADWKKMTWAERKAARLKELTDLQNWAKQNGIDPTYLFGHKMWHKVK